MKKSLSVIIPVHNEEKNLADAVVTIITSVRRIFDEYELIILNDASTDSTEEIAARLAKNNPNIRVVSFKKNRGFGAMYREGVMRAQKQYLIMVPGDNEILGESIAGILSHAGEADAILSYTANKEVRPWIRRAVSACFTGLLNLLFGFNLKYYNGMVLYETELVKKAKMTTDSFAFQAEILIRLLKGGCSYKEVPMLIRPYDESPTKMFRLSNMIGVIMTVLRLFLEIHLGKAAKKKTEAKNS